YHRRVKRTPPPDDRKLATRNWIVIEFNAWQHQRVVPPWWWLMASVSKQGSSALWRLDSPRWLRLKFWDYKWRLRGFGPGVLFVVLGIGFLWLVWKGLDQNKQGVTSAPAVAEGLAKSLTVVITLGLTVWGAMKALNRWLLVGSPRTAGQVLKAGKDPLDV